MYLCLLKICDMTGDGYQFKYYNGLYYKLWGNESINNCPDQCLRVD